MSQRLLHMFLPTMLAAAVLAAVILLPVKQGFAIVVHPPAVRSAGPTARGRCGASTARVVGTRGARNLVGGRGRCNAAVEAAARDGLASSSSGGATARGGNGASCTCRNCKQQFRRDDNGDDACAYHPGLFSGRLNRVNDVDTSGLEFFWSCCGEYDKADPGCAKGRHASYDDPPEGGASGWRSPLTGTLRSD